jgi:predicted nuclease of predicted toxin-antitoxin system
VRLLVDAQLPPARARWLTAQGHEAQHVFDVELTNAPDGAIWQFAIDTSATIVTKDEDFAVRCQLEAAASPVVWVRYGNVRKAELLRRFALVWPAVVESQARGERLIELA